MKNLSGKILTVLCAAALMISLASCAGKTETKEKSEAQTAVASAETKAETVVETQAEASAEAKASSSEKKTSENKKSANSGIIGSWEYEDGGFIYTFKSDGTGTYDAMGNKMKFTYEDTGSKLKIKYKDVDENMELEYELKGDILNVKDSGGNDTIYKRKK